MAEYKILITTSGLGSRLGNLTDYTNKSLVRVGDKPAISYIIESYPKDSNFVITLGHFGNHVQQFLQLAYPDYNFEFVQIDKYKGEGSSLGYSIYQCKDKLQCPFIFHASDTIVKNFNFIEPDINYVAGAYKKDASQYRTLNLYGGKLIYINEKGELHYDYSYIGLAGIKDYRLFFNNLEKLLQTDCKDLSDVHVINNMVPKVDFFYRHADTWFDIGNVAELSRAREEFKNDIEILDKKDESIFFFNDSIIKFFFNSEINKNRVIRTKHLNGLVPSIIDSTENFYKYKKVEGNLFSKSVNRNKFIKFLNWSHQYLWTSDYEFSSDFKDKCYDFYISKTKKRIEQFLKSNTDVPEYINGELIPSVHNLLESIDIDWLCNGIPSRFHGDFILDNIIEIKDGFTLIDWRQDFAGNLEVGDFYYDLAKLNHNLVINHDIVNKNLFNSSKDNCYILINSKLNECKGVLHSFIKDKGYDLKRVKVLTALIWINMAPLHEYPFNNFLFNFGKYNLYKTLQYGS